MKKMNPKEAACHDMVVEALQAFLSAAEKTKDVGPSDWRAGYTERHGVGIYLTEQYSAASQRAAIAVSELSNSDKSSIRSIEKDIRRRGFDVLSMPQRDICVIMENARLVIESAKSSQTSTVVTYLPNYLIKCDECAEFSIGPVSVVPAELTDTRVLRSKSSTRAELRLPPDHEDTNSMWVVENSCHVDNAYSEAVWLIDVAVSLLRVGCRDWKGGFFPHSGMLESHPSEHAKFFGIYSTMSNGVKSSGLDDIPRGITITKGILEELSSDRFRNKSDEIFYPQGKSLLGERISAGLGWMTRSRRARDRAERLLYAVTAIECLLSPGKNEGGITQTISRNASVILSPDLSGRFDIYRDIKKYYSDRSSVVHQGSRNVFMHHSVDMYFLAECMYREVVNKCDLKMKYSTFGDLLTEASLGGQWAP